MPLADTLRAALSNWLGAWDESQLAPLILGIAVILVVASWFAPSSKRKEPHHGTNGERLQADFYESRENEQEALDAKWTERPHIQGAFQPSTGLLTSNAKESFHFDNDFCSGEFLALHRATFDKRLDKSGKYPYGYHFKGRKRLWEMRLQMKFKTPPPTPLKFGIELEAYVPLSKSAQGVMAMLVTALKKTVGSDLYHSVGDDPKSGAGPHELPVFSMPLWAFDQFIETSEGETPPSLSDPDISNMGIRRTSNRHAFIQTMTDLDLKAGPVYTFMFWGISQFLDNILWEVVGVVPKWPMDFNKFCGKPPVHVVLYSLEPEITPGDHRHLQSRKNYYFRLAFWSSLKKPPKARLRELVVTGEEPDGAEGGRKHGFLQAMFTCCAGARSTG